MSHIRVRHPFLRCPEYVCWFGGTLAVAWFLLVSFRASTFQDAQARWLESLKQQPVQTVKLRPRDPFGKITIPRIGVSAMIAEGIDDVTLRQAVGHFPESSTPESTGTVALAGHRDTFFRGLAHVRLNDLIEVETPNGKYRYRVMRTAVVGPEHVELVQPSTESDLTLVTCFPFHYIGPAPQRFIVQALRIPPQ